MATMAGVRQLARAILTYYPDTKLDLSDDLDAKLWVALFKGVEDKALLWALAEYVRDGKRFAPNAGDIAEKLGRPALPSSNTKRTRDQCASAGLRRWCEEDGENPNTLRQYQQEEYAKAGLL